MKKMFVKALFALALLNVCVSFYSCEKENFNPKQKIKKIYYEMLPYYPKRLVQEWTWEKNKLASISYISGESIANTEYYTYDKNKLIKVEDDEGYFQITYDGAKYKRIEYNRKGGNISASWDFSYYTTSNKISTIIFTEYLNFDKKIETGFCSTLIPKEFISIIDEKLAKKSAKKSGEPFICTFKYAYKGDNIKKMTVEQEDSGELFTITTMYNSYDSMLNPYYKYVGLAEEQIATFFVTSKNNPLEVRIIRSEDYERETLIEYFYKYEKKFPVEIDITRTIVDDNISYSYKEYYEYQ
jgi:hypothetical protein